jgi:hypothetical protein
MVTPQCEPNEEDGRGNEEVVMPWSGIMAVVMEELIWFYRFM